jgi:hypothetical protein
MNKLFSLWEYALHSQTFENFVDQPRNKTKLSLVYSVTNGTQFGTITIGILALVAHAQNDGHIGIGI